ncbi:MAG: hypothetical protein COT73_07485 [Bdellovibrio sp. CG10_big_fil_rev_8_21_14_0_10_47_8]|nr:MAG: hypothetical protein COT73_07485 [Bdellovibrio sp. CG10_big_fil_rev_8_21_14_0_10_47_8]
MIKSTRKIPFEFIFEEIESRAPYVKPMFGAWAVYVDEKIIFILRDRPSYPEDNGVWLATTGEHHASLRKDFPNMRSIQIFGAGPTGWQVLPVDADDFEDSVLKACRFVLSADVRIGKIPKVKLKKSKK